MDRVCGIRAVILTLVVVLGVPGANLFAKIPPVVKSAKDVIVLQPSDPLPPDAQEVKSVDINGTDPTANCSYLEILAATKQMAVGLGANIIKITRHIPRSTSNECDAINAVLYRSASPVTYASELNWNENYKLTWDDFRGVLPANASDNTAAATFCGIGYETNTVTNNNEPKVFVYNTFYSNQSWVRAGVQTPEILAHEQGHFDLCELYTRKFRQRVANARITVADLKTTLENIYNQLDNEYEHRQQAYENETEHGLLAMQQQKWLQSIAQELQDTKQWAE